LMMIAEYYDSSLTSSRLTTTIPGPLCIFLFSL